MPYKSASLCFFVNLSIGVDSVNLYASASPCMRAVFHADEGLYGRIAHSSKDFDSSGIIRFKSNSIFSPKPVHSGQAPKGLLNEKRRGCSSGIEMPQEGHAFFCEKNTSASEDASPPAASFFFVTMMVPFELLSAVSTESAKRLRTEGEMIILSTTISIVCFFCLSSLTVSSKSAITPSTRARAKPAFRASSNTF